MTGASKPAAEPSPDLLAALQAAGAAQHAPVRWHRILALTERSRPTSGLAQTLLNEKLRLALHDLQTHMQAKPPTTEPTPGPSPGPSPLSSLLHDIAQKRQSSGPHTSSHWRSHSPRIEQFKQQLGKIRVQKQVAKAIAQAPQNAGPINSHMLVLRSLGLMRELSPDYLNRFMGYVDTLLSLEQAGQPKTAPKKTARSLGDK